MSKKCKKYTAMTGQLSQTTKNVKPQLMAQQLTRVFVEDVNTCHCLTRQNASTPTLLVSHRLVTDTVRRLC